MSQVIASTYEIIGKIGSGGGGNVYLANHLRLGKKVVLKADKRKITTRPELLRREVDILKDLRHSYIPKVYDYFVEDNITYTVMDFIEGESLDKPLRRGERFSQPQVIFWAKQLLEALCYLHSPTHGDPPRGYVHSDIKPSNLMRTPYNDICLIDFNIALALGEENVVGRSEGYASPEHYGLDYSSVGDSRSMRETEAETAGRTEETETAGNDTETETVENGTESETVTLSEMKSRTVYKKVVPDVRSDIYSVGATLYHLLSGRRPAKFADEVQPLSEKEFSPQIVHIISKAMNPNPDLRYQTAEEMLWDFKHLRENDPRTKRRKRNNRIACAALTLFFCAGVSAAFIGLKRMQSVETGLKLAEYSENALEEGNIGQAVQYALEAIPEKTGLLTPSAGSEAQKALADALGVYDLADGFKKRDVVSLEKNPLYLTVSPNGMTAACMCEKEIAVIDTQTAEVTASLSAEDSAMAEIEYIDNDTIIYAGEGGVTAYDITENQECWKGEHGTAVSVSEDGSAAAAVYKDESHAVIYDTQTGEKTGEIDFNGSHQNASMVSDGFANPYHNLFEINEDGTRIAASFSDGSLSVFDLKDGSEWKILDETSGYSSFEGGFSGDYLAFSASGEGSSVFAIIDTVQKTQAVGMESESSFHAKADENGIYVQVNNILVKIDPLTGEQTPLVTTDEAILEYAVGDRFTAVSTQDKILIFNSEAELVTEFENEQETGILQINNGQIYAARIDTPSISIMRYEEKADTEVAGYDPSFEHDEARISADENTVTLFSYQHFGIFDSEGNLIAETVLDEPENVYDQQFIRESGESRLDVTYNDGRVLSYSAADGSLISETQYEIPDMTLDEEFLTEDFRVEAPLHGTPQLYGRESGEKIADLEEDAYLTYVTQTGEYLITQYITADGVCYGELLDTAGNTLADLPYLCDVKDGELYFDCPGGSVRKTGIYDLDSLIEIAREKE